MQLHIEIYSLRALRSKAKQSLADFKNATKSQNHKDSLNYKALNVLCNLVFWCFCGSLIVRRGLLRPAGAGLIMTNSQGFFREGRRIGLPLHCLQRMLILLLCLLLSGVVGYVSGHPQDSPTPAVKNKVIVDETGRKVTLKKYPPERIISLAPSITELLFALNQGDKVVGITSYCNKPPETRTITKVGGFADPNMELIVSLKPDVVIATRQGNPVELIKNLDTFSIPIFALNAKNLTDVLRNILSVSQLLGIEQEGKKLHDKLAGYIEAQKRKFPQGKSRKRILFVIWYEPFITIGKESFIQEIIELCGAESATSHYPGDWMQINQEELLKLKYDAIMYAVHEPKQQQEFADSFTSKPGLLRTVPVYVVDEEILRPGINFPHAVDKCQQTIR
ncbi:MAG: hypothetical protein A2Y62_21355 [Candidatus Fischerbacteria bacterium RBG_13_37_8]|uniref:Fe/B12 periplasmic-binding domain-containing protein n=1 Tax=Candidatus Fischerbacteria bacterium RBG_13_37_8 TaxID=1817863 RepID=A0A1F5VT91_9BACT|nr:MAG: hypothetical protein A2Y62_21355 [Candidatus Fischerbacteria bacterium RBG_13_37_8]